jgi:hypothetical protein
MKFSKFILFPIAAVFVAGGIGIASIWGCLPDLFPTSNTTIQIPLDKFKKWINISFLIPTVLITSIMLFYTIYQNVVNLHIIGWMFEPEYELPIAYLQINQKWGMFSPNVLKDDGWYVSEAHLKNGKVIDLLADDYKLSYKKPEKVLDKIPNDRWRKLYENMSLVAYAWLRPYYCDYLVNTYNDAHKNNPIVIHKLLYYGEFTLPRGKKTEIKRFPLCNQDFKYMSLP